jgi:hypothetical protein
VSGCTQVCPGAKVGTFCIVIVAGLVPQYTFHPLTFGGAVVCTAKELPDTWIVAGAELAPSSPAALVHAMAT